MATDSNLNGEEWRRFIEFVRLNPDKSIHDSIRAVQFTMLAEGLNISGIAEPAKWVEHIVEGASRAMIDSKAMGAQISGQRMQMEMEKRRQYEEWRMRKIAAQSQHKVSPSLDVLAEEWEHWAKKGL